MKAMKVLIGCEASGTVRRKFEARGHDVWSCDVRRAEDGSNRHIVGDVRDYLDEGWDMLAVFHPPCTRLTNSGVRWLKEPPGKIHADHYTPEEIAAYKKMNREERLAFMWMKLDEGAKLFSTLWNAPIENVCVENPRMHCYAKERIENYAAPQIVQPWQFGHEEFKGTGLWLRGPRMTQLIPTKVLTPPKPGTAEHQRWSRVHQASPGPQRWIERSKFFDGIGEAMADQWGGEIPQDDLFRRAA